jgi:hypothetical protein
MKNIIALISLLALVIIGFSYWAAREPVARGEMRDRQAADQVLTCAQPYLLPDMPEADRDRIWQTCLETVAAETGRPIEGIRARITR